MEKTLTEYEFCREWETNETRKDQFTHGAQKALYEYLTQLEEDTGEEIELDIVAICCDFTEYESALECAKEYGYGELEDENIDDEEAQEADALEWLQDRTTAIPFDYRVTLSDGTVLGDAGVIIQNF